MLAFIRSVIQSRYGAAFGLVFLLLIVLAFAGADVGGMRSGNLLGGDDVANVGGAHVTTGELDKTLRAAFDGERQRTPALTMKDFLAQGAMDQVITGLVDRAATMEWGHKNGFAISDRLIDSEIAKLPVFQGPDGKFSQDVYTQMLTQRGLTDKLVREDIAKGLMSHLVFAGATEGAMMPAGVTQHYAALLKEKRTGDIAFLPSALFAPKAPATDQQIADYYKANIARYQRPERRTIRYAVIDDTVLRTIAPPSDADIRAAYQSGAARYAAGETRALTQVILPTQAAATAFAAEVAGGKTIDSAATAKGLAPAKIADIAHDPLATQTSKAVADAVFATAEGKVSIPAKGALGWVVARVDQIHKNPGKTIDQARPELITAVIASKRKAALTNLATQIGEQIEGGKGLADVAKANNLTLTTTDPVQADGRIPTHPDAKLSPQVQPLLQTVFAMDHEGQPQITPLPGGAGFAVFDVGTIVPASPAALAEIKPGVAADWARQQGANAADKAAETVLAALAKKQPLDAVTRSLGVAVPPISHIAITREQLSQLQGKVPAPYALMFSMTKGTAKKLAAPNQAGYLIVSLGNIEPGAIALDDPLVQQAGAELGKVTGHEYEEQLRSAITREIGVHRNENTIRTLRTNLSGGQ